MKLVHFFKACTALVLVYGTNAFAQQGTVSTGGDASGAGGTASYSIGQVDYMPIEGVGGKANLGLQQAFEIFTNSVVELGVLGANFYAYPNPSSGLITLSIQNAALSDLKYSLYDMQGRLIGSSEITSYDTVIDLNAFASGAYFIRLNNKDTEIKTFKIIKQ